MRTEQVQEVVRLTAVQVNLAAQARVALAEGDQSHEVAAVAMQAMADSGMSHRQIAPEVGCSPRRVDYFLKTLELVRTGVRKTWAEAMSEVRGDPHAARDAQARDARVAAKKDIPRMWVREVADGFAALFPAGRLPFLEVEDLVAVKTIKLAAEQILEAYDESNR